MASLLRVRVLRLELQVVPDAGECCGDSQKDVPPSVVDLDGGDEAQAVVVMDARPTRLPRPP